MQPYTRHVMANSVYHFYIYDPFSGTNQVVDPSYDCIDSCGFAHKLKYLLLPKFKFKTFPVFVF
jgi:hypothetical protein